MKAHKEKLRVIIYTSNQRIKGEVHLYENSRLTDILNADTATKDFLPVTNAELTDLRGGKTIEVSFLSINRKLIEVVMEDDEAVALGKCKDMLAKRKFPEALQFALRAVKVAPDHAEAVYLLGFSQAKAGDNKAAKATIERCLKLKPDPETQQKCQEMLSTLAS